MEDMDQSSIAIIIIVSAIIGYWILYMIIRSGVRDGILLATWKQRQIDQPKATSTKTPDEREWTEEQKNLKEQYDRGQITFQEYQKRWHEK